MTASPHFRRAYFVEDPTDEHAAVGFVRRRGAVWFVFQLGVHADAQPREVFATREEAGQHLLKLAAKTTD